MPATEKPEYLTIVTGLPRSGTSMVMQMLVAGGVEPCTDGVRAADESNPKGYWEDERVKRLAKENEWLLQAGGKVVKIVAPLLRWVPLGIDCRAIWIERGLQEVIASQTKMIARDGTRGAGLPADKLAAAFTQQCDAAKKLLAERPGASMLTLQHREVVANPQAAAEQIEAYLCLGLDVEAMAAAVAPELHRNRS